MPLWWRVAGCWRGWGLHAQWATGRRGFKIKAIAHAADSLCRQPRDHYRSHYALRCAHPDDISAHLVNRYRGGYRDYLAGDVAGCALRGQTGERRFSARHAHALHGTNCPFHGGSICPDRLSRVYEMKLSGGLCSTANQVIESFGRLKANRAFHEWLTSPTRSHSTTRALITGGGGSITPSSWCQRSNTWDNSSPHSRNSRRARSRQLFARRRATKFAERAESHRRLTKVSEKEGREWIRRAGTIAARNESRFQPRKLSGLPRTLIERRTFSAKHTPTYWPKVLYEAHRSSSKIPLRSPQTRLFRTIETKK